MYIRRDKMSLNIPFGEKGMVRDRSQRSTIVSNDASRCAHEKDNVLDAVSNCICFETFERVQKTIFGIRIHSHKNMGKSIFSFWQWSEAINVDGIERYGCFWNGVNVARECLRFAFAGEAG
jgi:hypothetical protein